MRSCVSLLIYANAYLTVVLFCKLLLFYLFIIVLRLLEGLAGSDSLASAKKSLPDVEERGFFLLYHFLYLPKI